MRRTFIVKLGPFNLSHSLGPSLVGVGELEPILNFIALAFRTP